MNPKCLVLEVTLFFLIFTYYQYMETMTKLFISFILLSNLFFAQSSKTILLSNASIHIGNGQVIENGLLSIKDGKIDLVANARVVKLISRNLIQPLIYLVSIFTLV